MRILNEFIKKNRFIFILFLILFSFCVVIGVLNLNLNFSEDLIDFGILSEYKNQNVMKIDILKVIVEHRIKILSLMYIIGMTVFGVVFIPIVLGVEGFFTGFTVAYIINIFSGLSHWKIIMVNLFFHLAFLIPLYLLQSVSSLKISLTLLSGNIKDIRLRIFLYSLAFVILLIVIAFLGILESNIYYNLIYLQ